LHAIKSFTNQLIKSNTGKMKKILLLGIGIGVGVSSFAQNSNGKPYKINHAVTNQKANYMPVELKNQETGTYFKVKAATPNHAVKSIIPEEKIGSTTYDLQTNSAIDRRLYNHGGGKISATWTLSTQLTTGWPDRGAGYNYRDGSAWGAYPTARLESERTGWPTLAVTSSSKEVVISHEPANYKLISEIRATAGTGSWTETGLTTLQPSVLWPRAVAGGANGESIHVIALTQPTGSGGTVYNGMDGALLYSRSTDGGATWDIKSIQVTGLNDTNYDGIGGDSYSIDAKGDVIAILVADFATEPTLFKSVDNGTTWTMTKLWDNGIGKYEESVDLIPASDSLPSGDGGCHVIIDNNGLVHCFSGIIYFFNEDLTDGGTNFYSNVIDGLVYWNENMGTGNYDIVGGVIDTDGNGTYDISVNTIPRFANSNNLASYPSAGIDASNNLYLVYTSVTELNDGDEYYRHTYGIKSTDGGTTWTDPVDLTPNDDFAECVFGTAAKMVDSKFYFWYQKGYDPGLNLTSSETNDLEENDIMIVTVDPSDFMTNINSLSENNQSVRLFPNPNNGNFFLSFSDAQTGNYNISVKNLLGQIIYQSTKTISGSMVLNLELNNIESGIYFVSVSNANTESVHKVVVR
jgi:hypothetical protein